MHFAKVKLTEWPSPVVPIVPKHSARRRTPPLSSPQPAPNHSRGIGLLTFMQNTTGDKESESPRLEKGDRDLRKRERAPEEGIRGVKGVMRGLYTHR
jgi:hypothetical protein